MSADKPRIVCIIHSVGSATEALKGTILCGDIYEGEARLSTNSALRDGIGVGDVVIYKAGTETRHARFEAKVTLPQTAQVEREDPGPDREDGLAT